MCIIYSDINVKAQGSFQIADEDSLEESRFTLEHT